jgi:hypothetical protein
MIPYILPINWWYVLRLTWLHGGLVGRRSSKLTAEGRRGSCQISRAKNTVSHQKRGMTWDNIVQTS